MGENAYKQSFSCPTLKIKIMENGRKIDEITVTDTVGLKKLMKKYSLR